MFKKNKEQLLAHKLHLAISELYIITYEYLMYREKRMVEQWNIKYNSTAKILKEEYKEFIGIYDESVPVELCNEFVENWQEAKKNATIIDMTKENVTQRIEKTPHPQRPLFPYLL